MKITTWNINGVKARLESARRLSAAGLARRHLPAGDQEPHRGLSGVRLRGPRLPLRRARPEGLQRRRHPVEAAARGDAHRAARQRRRRAVALHRGDHLGAVGHREGRFHLRAERQSDHHGEISLQARLARPPARAFPAAARRGDPVRHGRRLQRHPRADRRQAPRRVDERRALSSRRRAPPIAASSATG